MQPPKASKFGDRQSVLALWHAMAGAHAIFALASAGTADRTHLEDCSPMNLGDRRCLAQGQVLTNQSQQARVRERC